MGYINCMLSGGGKMKVWINKEDSSIPEDEWKDSFVFSVNRDTYSTIYTSVSKLWYGMDQIEIKDIYEDLFIIGLCIFAIDKRVSRRQFLDCWTRQLDVSIPVLKLSEWEDCKEDWNKILGFLTGDIWNITFRQSDKKYSRHKNSNKKHIDVSACDCVCLFSGGLDSYCGAVHLLENGKSPCLVGHNEYPKLRIKQEKFAATFQQLYPNQKVQFLGFTANSRAPKDINGNPLKKSENTSRGRSLLFLCTAISIAGILGVDTPVYIPENGFIGLNIPLTDSRKGTCSTRTTHPYFIREFSKLLKKVNIKNPIYNFYAFMTKKEVVEDVRNTDAFNEHYEETISCSHPCQARWNRNGNNEYPINCGYCYPCLIRRSSLQKIRFKKEKYSFDQEFGDFLVDYSRSDKSSDLRAVINSIYQYKNSTDDEIRRKIRLAGKLSKEDVDNFLLVYKETMGDLESMFDADESIKKMLGDNK